MERFQQELAEGARKLRAADHLVTITHPLVKDNRLLLAALDNLFAGVQSLMASLLHYEEAFKRIPRVRGGFVEMLHVFRTRCVPEYRLASEYGRLLGELKSLDDQHRASAVEFARKDCLVICSDTYTVRKVTVQDLKSYVVTAKKLLSDVEEVVSSYEGVFGRGKGRAQAR